MIIAFDEHNVLVSYQDNVNGVERNHRNIRIPANVNYDDDAEYYGHNECTLS